MTVRLIHFDDGAGHNFCNGGSLDGLTGYWTNVTCETCKTRHNLMVADGIILPLKGDDGLSL